MKRNLSLVINKYNVATLAGILLLCFYFGSKDLSAVAASVCAIFLATSIYTAVHSAETVANRVGPSLGGLILAIAVTVIEVGLIVSMMATESTEASKVARDTVFAAVMIVSNGIVGVCLVIAGFYHEEADFQPQGTSSLLGILGVLSALTLVLPNFTVSSQGPTYSNAQLIFVSIISLVLYGMLVWSQTVAHKNFFTTMTKAELKKLAAAEYVPSIAKTWVSFFRLLVSLIVVIGLAKTLSPTIEATLSSLGAPRATVGIIIALLVLLPETFAALQAAKANQLQSSLNLALGSGAASIALTIPVVSAYTIYEGRPLVLGLEAKSTAFFTLTFVTAALTLSGDKATSLKGVIHLAILVGYIALSFMP